MSRPLTWPKPSGLSSPRTVTRTTKNSWNATQSLKQLLSGRTPKKYFPSTLPPLPVLPTLPALSSPTFDPTLTSPSSVPSTPGLFEALLGDPRILLRDYLEHPTHYEPELLTTLTSLLSGNKTLASLTNEERDLLNQSTTTYAEQPNSSTTSSTKPPDALPFQTRPPRDDEDEDEEETDEEPWRDSQEDPLLSFNEDPAPHEDDDVAPPVATGWWNHLP